MARVVIVVMAKALSNERVKVPMNIPTLSPTRAKSNKMAKIVKYMSASK